MVENVYPHRNTKSFRNLAGGILPSKVLIQQGRNKGGQRIDYGGICVRFIQAVERLQRRSINSAEHLYSAFAKINYSVLVTIDLGKICLGKAEGKCTIFVGGNR